MLALRLWGAVSGRATQREQGAVNGAFTYPWVEGWASGKAGVGGHQGEAE